MLSLQKIIEIAEACGVEVSNECDGNHYVLDSYGNKQIFRVSSIPYIPLDSFSLKVKTQVYKENYKLFISNKSYEYNKNYLADVSPSFEDSQGQSNPNEGITLAA